MLVLLSSFTDDAVSVCHSVALSFWFRGSSFNVGFGGFQPLDHKYGNKIKG